MPILHIVALKTKEGVDDDQMMRAFAEMRIDQRMPHLLYDYVWFLGIRFPFSFLWTFFKTTSTWVPLLDSFSHLFFSFIPWTLSERPSEELSRLNKQTFHA